MPAPRSNPQDGVDRKPVTPETAKPDPRARLRIVCRSSASYAAAAASVGTEAIVFSTCEAIW